MKNYTRREMLHQSALAAGLCTCYAASAFAAQSDCCNTPDLEPESYSISPDRIVVDVAKTFSLAEPGHAAFISLPEQKIEIILVRADVESFAALSRFCTHGMQVLSYNQARGLLQCNSYNHSLFELNGQVFKGPAPKPLTVYKTEFAAETLTVFLQEA